MTVLTIIYVFLGDKMKKKVIVVMPAYNAEKTVEMTYNEIPFDIVDEVILVDDASQDRTVDIAKTLDMHVIEHPVNMGYGPIKKAVILKRCGGRRMLLSCSMRTISISRLV